MCVVAAAAEELVCGAERPMDEEDAAAPVGGDGGRRGPGGLWSPRSPRRRRGPGGGLAWVPGSGPGVCWLAGCLVFGASGRSPLDGLGLPGPPVK